MKKKILAIFLAVLMLVGLVACAANEPPATTEPDSTTDSEVQSNPENKNKKPVVLEWHYRGNGIQRDTEAVNDHINELLHQVEGFENISVHLNPYLAADYASSVTLAQSTGEQIDILNTVGLNYVTEVNNGTFIALDEMLNEEQFSALKNELPEWLWSKVAVNDSTYIVPNYQQGSNMQYLVFPAKYAEGENGVDVDAIREMLKGSYTAVDLDNIMRQVVDAARKIDGVDTKYLYPAVNGLLFSNGIEYKEFISNYGINDGFCVLAGTTEVVNNYLTDSYKAAVESAAKDEVDGYLVPEMALRDSVESLRRSNALNDEAIVVWMDSSMGSEEEVSAQFTNSFGYETIAIPMHQQYYFDSSWGAGGNGITATCEHPVEALKFLQLINTEAGEEIYNTIVYGLEGTHYEKNADGTITTLEYDGSQGSDNNYSAHKWIMGNTFHAWLNQGCSAETNEIAMEINNSTDNIVSPTMGFRYDTSNVTTELDQIGAVVSEFYDPMRFGGKGADWESYYDEFVSKLEAAGASKVQADMQAQLDAFLNG